MKKPGGTISRTLAKLSGNPWKTLGNHSGSIGKTIHTYHPNLHPKLPSPLPPLPLLLKPSIVDASLGRQTIPHRCISASSLNVFMMGPPRQLLKYIANHCDVVDMTSTAQCIWKQCALHIVIATWLAKADVMVSQAHLQRTGKHFAYTLSSVGQAR